MDRVNAGPRLTIDGAIDEVRKHYEGEIVSVSQDGDDYRVKLKTTVGLYAITVHSASGGIADIQQVEAYEQPAGVDDGSVEPAVDPAMPEDVQTEGQSGVAPGERPSRPASPSGKTDAKDVLIKRETAISIALDKINGEVDEIELRESDGVRYYLVEVDTDDDREAMVQINAASGTIMSIAWDDDDDQDD